MRVCVCMCVCTRSLCYHSEPDFWDRVSYWTFAHWFWQTCFHQLVPGIILPVFPQCWVTDPQWPKNIFYLIWQSHTHVQCSLILPFINCSWRLPNPLSCLHDNCPPIPSSLRPVSAVGVLIVPVGLAWCGFLSTVAIMSGEGSISQHPTVPSHSVHPPSVIAPNLGW